MRPPSVPTTNGILSAVRNAIVHERDRLQNQVDHLERELASLTAKRRHFMEVICDRCKTSLTASSATEPARHTLESALRKLVVDERWVVSRETAAELLLRFGDDRDLCSSCATLLMRPERAKEAQ